VSGVQLNVPGFLQRVQDMLHSYALHLDHTPNSDGVALLIAPETWEAVVLYCGQGFIKGYTHVVNTKPPRIYKIPVIRAMDVPLGDVYVVLPEGHRFLSGPKIKKKPLPPSQTLQEKLMAYESTTPYVYSGNPSMGVYQQQQQQEYVYNWKPNTVTITGTPTSGFVSLSYGGNKLKLNDDGTVSPVEYPDVAEPEPSKESSPPSQPPPGSGIKFGSDCDWGNTVTVKAEDIAPLNSSANLFNDIYSVATNSYVKANSFSNPKLKLSGITHVDPEVGKVLSEADVDKVWDDADDGDDEEPW
jgi:hypothetical protein